MHIEYNNDDLIFNKIITLNILYTIKYDKYY